MLKINFFHKSVILLAIAYGLVQFSMKIKYDHFWDQLITWVVGYAATCLVVSRVTRLSIPAITIIICIALGTFSGNGISLAILYLMVVASIIFGGESAKFYQVLILVIYTI